MGYRDCQPFEIKSFGERSSSGPAGARAKRFVGAQCVGDSSAYLGPSLALAMAARDAGSIADGMDNVATVLVNFP